jgi:hypothetical protein
MMASKSLKSDSVFQEVGARISEAQELLASESDRVKAEREQLERDFPKMQKFHGKPIKLDVGGTVFKTSLETLTKESDSMLASMFSGRFGMKAQDDGSFFIDRDPTHFRYILNFLRTGKIIVPDDAVVREELLLEANFYNVGPMLEKLTALLAKVKVAGFEGSSLLNSSDTTQLLSWLNGKSNWRLIYKASRDGFRASDFHYCCDNKGETVSIICTTANYLFGGYTDVSWTSTNGQHSNSAQSFLFAFRSHSLGNSSVKTNVSSANHAVYHHSSYCCTFGAGHCIYVADSSNTNDSSYSNWHSGQSYSFPINVGSSNNHWLVGQQNFQTRDVEVFGHT